MSARTVYNRPDTHAIADRDDRLMTLTLLHLPLSVAYCCCCCLKLVDHLQHVFMLKLYPNTVVLAASIGSGVQLITLVPRRYPSASQHSKLSVLTLRVLQMYLTVFDTVARIQNFIFNRPMTILQTKVTSYFSEINLCIR